MTDDDAICTSVRLPATLNAAIEGELDYSDSKGEWIQEACRMRLQREDEAAPQQ